MGSILLDDVRVGAHSIVAAGALLSPGTVVPPRSLVMGVPAKVKRTLTDEEVAGHSEIAACLQKSGRFSCGHFSEDRGLRTED